MILLHWGMALLIFFLFGLGLYMVELTYYDPWYRSTTALHKSLGVCVGALLLLRIVWRSVVARKIRPVSKINKLEGMERKLALTMHCLLYLCMAAICMSGYLISTAGGREIDVLGFFKLPALPVELDRQEDLAGVWHFYLAWGIIVMTFGHAMAALKHHFINKDNVLKSMLWSFKNK